MTTAPLQLPNPAPLSAAVPTTAPLIKTTRFRLAAHEAIVLRDVSSMLAGRLELAMHGHAPHRHPWDRVDLIASDVYKEREFYEDLASIVLSCRDKLNHLGGSRKVRANIWQLSTMQLALRFAVREKYVTLPAKWLARLTRKLDLHWTRAKRAAVKQLGDSQYHATAERWERFLGWLRFYLLYDRVPRKRAGTLKMTWRWQFSEILKLARQAIEKCSEVVLPEEVLRKVVRLAVDNMRRRDRPGISVMTAIRNPAEGERFLFHFISRRINLQPLKYEYLVSVMRNEIDHLPRLPNQRPAQSSIGAGAHGISNALGTMRSAQTVPATDRELQFEQLKCLSEDRLSTIVGEWFRANFHPDSWERIAEQAKLQITFFPPRMFPYTLPARTVDGIISNSRPPFGSDDEPGEGLDELNYGANWLVAWLLLLTSNPSPIYRIIGKGLAAAKEAEEKARQLQAESDFRARQAARWA